MKILKLLAAAAAASSMLSAPAKADYPDKAITFIIPYGPGGTSDVGARTWGPFMETCLGQTIVFVNKPGAGGELGFSELAATAPDGYTLGALNVPNYPSGTITKPDARYKLDSFDLLGNFYGSIVSINTKKGGQYDTLAKLVDAAKAGTNINMAISNFGSDDHLKMLAFMKAAGVKFTFIPMADAATSRNAVMGGHVDVSGNSMTEVAGFQNELQTLAVASEGPREELPGVPTFKEQGYDILGGSSHVIGGPKGLPAPVADKIAGCIESVAADPEFQKVAKERKLLLSPMNRTQVSDYAKKESDTIQSLWSSDPWVK